MLLAVLGGISAEVVQEGKTKRDLGNAWYQIDCAQIFLSAAENENKEKIQLLNNQ